MEEKTMAKCIMIQGTMSGAGKSLLVTALCRIFREDGYRVAPFKSQNMALNSYITKDGLEMGRAQAAQAEAAGKEPDVRMNPILLKPTSDVGSQVIVNGKVYGTLKARDYFQMKRTLIPDILSAYESLADENDIIVIEGAGSPAEINLKADDIVNMGLAELVDAPVILVGDIDPGGVFAQLYGTIALLNEKERKRIIGTVINKFRGDVEILRPGLKMLEDLTKVPCLGVVPYAEVDIDDEDSLSTRLETERHGKVIDIAVIRLPRISNFTDFSPLEEHPALGVRYVKKCRDLGDPDMIILPGTKSTMADLKWLRESGLETLIIRKVRKGTPILGVCGGYQMLGSKLTDPYGVEENAGGTSMTGMELLPTVTTFSESKRRTRVNGRVPAGPWGGAELEGYEIHMGKTEPVHPYAGFAASPSGSSSRFTVPPEQDTSYIGQPLVTLDGGEQDGWQCGNVFGTYLHGLFDTGELTNIVADHLMHRRGIDPMNFRAENRSEYRERQYRELAAVVRSSLDMEELYRIIKEF